MLVNINDITKRKKNIKTYSNWQDNIEGLQVRLNPEKGDELNKPMNKKVEILEDD